MSRSRAACVFLVSTALVLATALPAQTPAPAPPTPRDPSVELFGKSLDVARQALEQYGAWDDPEAMARVDDLGYRVAAQTGFTRFPISFYLVNMAEPNAFALPGGQVFVTRGMMELNLSDDALAALLGHEIGHVVGEHNQRMQRRATLLNVLSQALMVGVILKADRSGPSTTGVPDPYGLERERSNTGNVIEGTYAASLIVSELLLASYSRTFENEADDVGQRWAAAAGFDPDGTRKLMAELGSRLPESKEYGYWRTHPYFEERVLAAKARGADLRRSTDLRADDAFRRETQATLLKLAEKLPKPKERPDADRPPREDRRPPEDRPREAARKPPLDAVALVKEAALDAWPSGERADALRSEKLHHERELELAKPALARNYGTVLATYDEEIAAVARLTPESPFLPTVRAEREALAKQKEDAYPQAQAIWTSGVYEIPFLETFLANYPTVTEVPDVSLALGDAYSRLDRQSDAVARYLAAVRAAPDSPAAAKARRGLHVLAPRLEQLAALAEIAADSSDTELQKVARERLAAKAGTFSRLADGAEYLERFPESEHATVVTERLNTLAQNLYGEVILYQGVGDALKALDRIQQILTYAPTSPAADRLRERVVVAG